MIGIKVDEEGQWWGVGEGEEFECRSPSGVMPDAELPKACRYRYYSGPKFLSVGTLDILFTHELVCLAAKRDIGRMKMVFSEEFSTRYLDPMLAALEENTGCSGRSEEELIRFLIDLEE